MFGKREEAELPELQIEETESYVRFNLYRSYSEYTEEISKNFGLNPEDYTESEYRILKEIAVHPTVTNEELSQIIRQFYMKQNGKRWKIFL